MALKISGSYTERQRPALKKIISRPHLLSGQVDTLGIASSLNVEYTGITPHMLVVSDQQAIWIGGQCRLAGAAQTKEQSDIATISLGLVGRGM